MPWEAMSFPKMSLKDKAYEEWNDINNNYNHFLKVDMDKNFIFLNFKNLKKSNQDEI